MLIPVVFRKEKVAADPWSLCVTFFLVLTFRLVLQKGRNDIFDNLIIIKMTVKKAVRERYESSRTPAMFEILFTL